MAGQGSIDKKIGQVSKPNGICALSVADIVERYKKKTLSPVEVLKATIERIERYNSSVNAFAFLDPASAFIEAKASEERWAKNVPRSQIDGVLATLKDTILARNWPTLCGSMAIEPQDESWEVDAPATARLRESGAILIGKTTMSEFGVKAVTESERHGITRNPVNLGYSPGGSSGGAASAAAAGFGQLHVSTDGGGSTRVPASLTGVVGFMPTYGRIPQFPENYQGSRFHIGINTRSVHDAATLLSVLTRPDLRDWNALPYEERNWVDVLQQGIEGLRIGYFPTLGSDQVEPEVSTVIEHAIGKLESVGATVKRMEPSWLDYTSVHRTLGDVAMARLVSGIRPERRELLGGSIVQRADRGRSIDAVTYVRALEDRANLGRHLLEVYESIDLLVTPVTTFASLEIGGGDGVRFSQTNLFNMTQQPACSVPCGITQKGLPVGLQIVGQKYDDAVVLRAASRLEMLFSQN